MREDIGEMLVKDNQADTMKSTNSGAKPGWVMKKEKSLVRKFKVEGITNQDKSLAQEGLRSLNR